MTAVFNFSMSNLQDWPFYFETLEANMRRLVLLFLPFVWHALHRKRIDWHRKRERGKINSFYMNARQAVSALFYSQTWRIFSRALGCHPQTGEVKPVIITQTCREKWGVSHQLFCSVLNSRFQCRLFHVRIGGVLPQSNVRLCYCLIPMQIAIWIKITHLKQISICIFCMYSMSACSNLWAGSHWFKRQTQGWQRQVS